MSAEDVAEMTAAALDLACTRTLYLLADGLTAVAIQPDGSEWIEVVA